MKPLALGMAAALISVAAIAQTSGTSTNQLIPPKQQQTGQSGTDTKASGSAQTQQTQSSGQAQTSGSAQQNTQTSTQTEQRTNTGGTRVGVGVEQQQSVLSFGRATAEEEPRRAVRGRCAVVTVEE